MGEGGAGAQAGEGEEEGGERPALAVDGGAGGAEEEASPSPSQPQDLAVDGEVAEEGRRKWRQGDYQLPGQAVVGEVGGDQEEGDDGVTWQMEEDHLHRTCPHI